MNAGKRCSTAFAALALLAVACTAEQREALTHIQNAYNAVVKQYPGATVNLNLVNDRHLVITVINSAFNDRTAAERQAQARRSAQTALTAFGQPVDDIRVTFIRRKGFGITVAVTLGSYVFTAEELGGTSRP